MICLCKEFACISTLLVVAAAAAFIHKENLRGKIETFVAIVLVYVVKRSKCRLNKQVLLPTNLIQISIADYFLSPLE